jgi:RNA polymerase sigma-70 factor (ECF subfamily)
MGSAATREEWIDRLRAGEHAAFAELVARETGRLLSVLRRILRSEEEAKDCLQDAFMAAFRGLPNFNGDASISTWLHRITVNIALMRLRTMRRSREHLLDDVDLDGTVSALAADREVFQWRPADPETALTNRQTAAFVANSLEQLSDEHRSVILLRDFDDLNTAQAAERLGTNPDALKMRLHRARASLRDMIVSDLAHLDIVRTDATSGPTAEVAAA